MWTLYSLSLATAFERDTHVESQRTKASADTSPQNTILRSIYAGLHLCYLSIREFVFCPDAKTGTEDIRDRSDTQTSFVYP